MRVNPIYSDFSITTSITRSTDATQYTAGDAITSATTTPLTFSNIGVNAGQTVLVTDILVTSSVKGAASPLMNIWLFNATPTATADNSALALSDAQNNTVEAVIPMSEGYTATNNARLEKYGSPRQITLGSTTRDLFALLEATSTYTPTASEVITVTLKGLRL